MTKTLALLVASTALSVTIGAPVRAATPTPTTPVQQPLATRISDSAQALPLVLVSGDDDEDHEDDDCDDDDRTCGAQGANPAPAGSAAPPKNGLFGSGTPPKAQMN
ncbi:MAG: hypothetical protein BGP11_16290 [Rhodobacterales bacterium 65-51]|uniref:hypothetical protein n=1 Tax=uncultured Gemmobacter sp. TaxID=1095917 RepID=UPI00095AC4C3|nr:hypothetical protein [uncultured Gemmobacter sp.]OJY34845.1 MAG: hypothetical protein BGP11_16290 [Rhodobacterales bacterium 65-51]